MYPTQNTWQEVKQSNTQIYTNLQELSESITIYMGAKIQLHHIIILKYSFISCIWGPVSSDPKGERVPFKKAVLIGNQEEKKKII